MGDLTEVLAGTVEEVKSALVGRSHVDLHELRKQEAAGKNRSGVLSAIDAALKEDDSAGNDDAADSAANAASTTDEAATDSQAAAADASTDTAAAPANLPPATEIDTSGAPQQIVPDVDMSHPAVDANPRANTTDVQNRIDFNDPNKSGLDVVEEALAQRQAD